MVLQASRLLRGCVAAARTQLLGPGKKRWNDAPRALIHSLADGVTPNEVFVNQELDLGSIQWIGGAFV